MPVSTLPSQSSGDVDACPRLRDGPQRLACHTLMLASNMIEFGDLDSYRLVCTRPLSTPFRFQVLSTQRKYEKRKPPSESFAKNPLHLPPNHTGLPRNPRRPGRRRRRVRNLAQPRQRRSRISQRPILALRRRRRPNQRPVLRHFVRKLM
jgi:hypothetical protein